MVAFVGLEGDSYSLSQALQTEVSSKLNRALGFDVSGADRAGEEVSRFRRISPNALASITSHILYNGRGRYLVQPLVVGIKDNSKSPFLCAMDSIGAQSLSDSFVCSGAASKSLYGTAEAFWKPNLEPDELAAVCGKAFQSALERDCYSGYGAVVYLISRHGIMEYDLASRND